MELCCKKYPNGWIYPTVLLCLYGFFVNLNATDPFIIPYLVGSYHNLTAVQVANSVLPVWTYSYLALLIPVFLLTDYLCYKPVIFLQGLGLSISMIIMLFTHGVPAMQGMEFAYAIFTSCDVAYYAYIYNVVDTVHYQRVTSYCRSITLVGATLGALGGQLLLSLAGVSYFTLNVLTLTLTLVGLVFTLFLPMPTRSMFFHKQMAGDTIKMSVQQAESPCLEKIKAAATGKDTEPDSKHLSRVLFLLSKEVKQCYSSKQIVYWSLWWAFATPIYNQLICYAPILWEHVESSKTMAVYNGGVEALSTFLGALLSLLVGHVKVSWTMSSELALTVFSIAEAGALFLMALSRNIWMCYAGFLIFKSSYMLLITITTFKVAVNLSMEHYALLFGINTLAALALQTLLSLIVVDPVGLGLDIFRQFLVYGCYFAVITGIFFVRSMYILISLYCKKSEDAIKEQTRF
uniref:Thiamine transporter 2 n=1 Tax=Xenopus tropicalis TaxID=8364 RepID=A0A803JJF9_XENTR